MTFTRTLKIVLVLYLTFATIKSGTCRQRWQRSHNRSNHRRHNLTSPDMRAWLHSSQDLHTPVKEDSEEDKGRHAYLMSSGDRAEEKLDDDQTLTLAFEKHVRPPSKQFNNAHDVYAYKLPSDLWFVIRYLKNADGQYDKYMNIVDSVTTYLDKLGKDVKTVSLNVKGVETVFRLNTKHHENKS